MPVALEVVADLPQEPQAAQPRFRGTLRLERVQASQRGATAVQCGACGPFTTPMRLNEGVAGGHRQPELEGGKDSGKKHTDRSELTIGTPLISGPPSHGQRLY